MAQTKRQQLGDKGEDFALQYLIARGYTILDTNWRWDRGELDIVSKMDGFLVVTEVKTRTTTKYGNPLDDISERQQEKLIETAEAYLEQNDLDFELRFDIISVVLEPKVELDHLEDAF